MNKTHWKKWNNPNYLGPYAFQPGEEKTVTIKEVKREIVQNQNGKEECTVAYFVEDLKPLILNTTNCKTITKVWGTPYIEDWSGRKITLKVKKISAFGALAVCVWGVMLLDADSALPVIMCLVSLTWLFAVLVMKWDEIVRKYDEVDWLIFNDEEDK